MSQATYPNRATGGHKTMMTLTEWPHGFYRAGKDLPERRRIVVTAGLHKLGDQVPYFSVTADLVNLRCRKDSDRRIEACGAMHEEVLKHFPKLAPVVALHLSDIDGAPMHAQANARYWMGLTEFKTWERTYGKPEPLPALDVLARHLRISEDEAAELVARHPAYTDALEAEIEAMRPRWKAEADAARQLLDRLRGEEG